MISSHKVRALSAVLLVAAIGFAALPGCGNSGPSKAGDKKDDKKEDPKPGPKPDDKKDDKKDNTPVEPKTTLGPVEDAAEKAALAFMKDLGTGSVKADALTPALLDAAGKPWELPEDITNKLSPKAAERWLRAAGENRTFTPSLDRKQAGDAVYFRGALQPTGGYSLRMVKVGGAWKVDWFSVSSAELKGTAPEGSADEAFQGFAVSAFAEVVADGTALQQPLRAPLLARGLTPALRAAWAPPFDADKAQGYDYSPGKLTRKAVEDGGGTTAFTVAKAGDATFTVEFTKPAGKKALTIKLVKGAAPGEWLVSEVGEKG